MAFSRMIKLDFQHYALALGLLQVHLVLIITSHAVQTVIPAKGYTKKTEKQYFACFC